ncbi:MAG TPA: hypothetical protein PKN75_04165 [Bacteroidia bacterium]|nr:hypothetical protein [Bacteroidia bacterium]HNU32765.1 hypothetical protein [Bacteroidia bacterium]
MKKKSALLIAFFSVISFSNAQNITWLPSPKIADRIYQTYLGSDGTLHYSAGSNIRMIQEDNDSLLPPPQWKKLKFSLFRYDQKFLMKDTLPLKFGNIPRNYFNTIMTDKKIRLIYSYTSGDKLTCRSDNFDLTGKFIDVTVLDEAAGLPDFEVKKYYKLIFSDDKKTIAVIYKSGVVAYNEKMEKIWKIDADMNGYISGAVTTDGNFFALTQKDKDYNVVAVDSKGIKAEKKMTPSSQQNASFRCGINNGKIYIVSLNGVIYKNFNPDWGRLSDAPRFMSKALQINVFDMALQEEKVLNADYTNDVLLTCNERGMLQKIKGIEWIYISAIQFSANGDVIAILENTRREPTDTKPVQGMKIEMPGFTTYANHIVAIRVDAQGKTQQAVISRKGASNEIFDYVLNAGCAMKGDDLYIYYHEGRDETEYNLNEVIMDKTMRIIYNKNLPDIIEKKRTFLDLNNMYALDHNRKIVYGRIAKKTIAASLDFK